jgi:hypothetical protein
VISDSVLTAVTGSGSSGYVDVATAGGMASQPGFLFVYPTPVVTSFSPDSAGTGQTVTIHGSHFTGVDTAAFGGYGVYSLTVVSDTLITAVVGTGGSGSVTVEGPGKFASLGGFTFISTPSPNLIGLQLSLYPNPTVGSLQTASVPGTTTQSSQFELVDLNGRILKVIPVAPNTSQVQINTSGLNKGVYKLVWSDGKHTSNKTILVL